MAFEVILVGIYLAVSVSLLKVGYAYSRLRSSASQWERGCSVWYQVNIRGLCSLFTLEQGGVG